MSAPDTRTPAPTAIPEIDYEALIADCKRITGYAAGTGGCVAFAKGAEWMRARAALAAPQSATAEPLTDAEKYSADLTRAKNLLVRLWDKHPETRPMIEGATGSWFAWGVDRNALQSAPTAEPAQSDVLRYQWLRARLHSADFDYGEPGEKRSVLIFDWPQNAWISADLDAAIDAAKATP